MAEKTTMVDDAQEKDELVLEDNQLVCARLSLKPWGIALKFLFLHHENILFPND